MIATLPAARTRLPYYRRVLNVSAIPPIGYWTLGDFGTPVAIDETGNGRTGADSGPTQGYAGIGDGRSARLFDGVNDFVNVYSAGFAAAFNTAEGTAHAWIRVASAGVWTDATERRICEFQADSSNRVRMLKSTTNNRLTIEYRAGGTIETINVDSQSSLNWLHVAITWSKTAEEVRAYVDGALVGTSTTLGVWAGALLSTRCCIGANDTTGATPWSGYLAHIALWTYPLSVGQIAALAVL